jgi:23S rRNA pseudouridine955/2504/2580 synthase
MVSILTDLWLFSVYNNIMIKTLSNDRIFPFSASPGYHWIMSIEMIAAADDAGRRLDRILRKALPELPLSAVHRLLRKGLVLTDGVPAKASDRIAEGTLIQIPGEPDKPLPAPGTAGPSTTPSGPRPSPLPGKPSRRPLPAKPPYSLTPPEILWEGAGLLIVNKPSGVAVHGAGSLEAQVRSYLAGRLPPSLSFRPGPLHRLDKPTSGLIVFSASLEGARYFSALIREGRVKKRYLALVDGIIGEAEIWEDLLLRDGTRRKTLIVPSAGPETREARTRVFPLAVSAAHTLIMAEIDTGRTHQIRAQAAAHGHPLAGDGKYRGSPRPGGLLLHAHTLEFPVRGGAPPVRVCAPVPAAFRREIELVFGGFNLKGNEAVPKLQLLEQVRIIMDKPEGDKSHL